MFREIACVCIALVAVTTLGQELLGQEAQSQEAQSQEAQSQEAPDETGEVFPALAEMTFLRDSLQKTPHAVVGIGERHIAPTTDDPGRITPLYVIRAIGPKGFQYYASCTIVRTPTRDVQHWQENYRRGSDVYRRGGAGTTDREFMKKPKDVSRDDFLGTSVMYCDPIEDVLCLSMGFTGKIQAKHVIEKVFLNKAKFTGADRAGNLITSKWDLSWDPPVDDTDYIGYNIELVHSAANDFFPVKVSYDGKKGIYDDGFTQRRIQWKRIKGRRLPWRVETAASLLNTDPVRQTHLKLLWCFDKDVINQLVNEKKHFKEHLMRHFDLAFAHLDENGNPIYPFWQTPDDLFIQ